METAPGLFTLSVWSFNSFCLANTTVSVSYCSNAEKRDQPIGENISWKNHYSTLMTQIIQIVFKLLAINFYNKFLVILVLIHKLHIINITSLIMKSSVVRQGSFFCSRLAAYFSCISLRVLFKVCSRIKRFRPYISLLWNSQVHPISPKMCCKTPSIFLRWF